MPKNRILFALIVLNVILLLALLVRSPVVPIYQKYSPSIEKRENTREQHNHDQYRLCLENPYHHALVEPLEVVSTKMKDWLSTESVQVGSVLSMDSSYRVHTHKRFLPFVPMATCNSSQLDCIGGECGQDESKIVCGLQNHVVTAAAASTNQESSSTSEGRCVIYSIGSQNKWRFENDLLERTPCEIHTFDCTGPRDRFRVPNNTRLHFHHVCLTAYSQHGRHNPDGRMIGESWTLLEMQQKLGHSRIDILKMDIEGWEHPLFYSWPELAYVEESEKVLLPMQIMVEIHYRTQFEALHPDRNDFLTPVNLLELQNHLLRMGYAVVARDDNQYCPHCTELTLLRIHCPDSGVYGRNETA